MNNRKSGVSFRNQLYEGVNHLCTISRCVRNANLRFFSHVLEPEGYGSQQMDIRCVVAIYISIITLETTAC